MIFKLPVALTGILLATAVDTTWWNGSGGTVTEHRDQSAVTCWLTLKDHQSHVSIAWSNRVPLRVVVESADFRFPPDQMMRVAMRISSTWLGGGDGKPNILALTARSSVMFILNEPVEDMLASARDISVRTPDQTLSIKLVPDETKDLLRALAKCNAVVSRLS